MVLVFFYDESKFYGGKICRVVDISSSCTELSVYIPKFCGWFQYDISYIAGSYFSSGLVFNIYEMSIVLNGDNSISRSPFKVPFARLFVFEVYMISYLEGWFFLCHCLLGCFKSVLI